MSSNSALACGAFGALKVVGVGSVAEVADGTPQTTPQPSGQPCGCWQMTASPGAQAGGVQTGIPVGPDGVGVAASNVSVSELSGVRVGGSEDGVGVPPAAPKLQASAAKHRN